jgi:hypothetical protein
MTGTNETSAATGGIFSTFLAAKSRFKNAGKRAQKPRKQGPQKTRKMSPNFPQLFRKKGGATEPW